MVQRCLVLCICMCMGVSCDFHLLVASRLSASMASIFSFDMRGRRLAHGWSFITLCVPYMSSHDHPQSYCSHRMALVFTSTPP